MLNEPGFLQLDSRVKFTYSTKHLKNFSKDEKFAAANLIILREKKS